MFIGLHVKYPLFSSDFNEEIFSCIISKKILFELRFHENPSSGSRIVAWGRKDGQRDVTKLTNAFRRFANVSKKKDKESIRK